MGKVVVTKAVWDVYVGGYQRCNVYNLRLASFRRIDEKMPFTCSAEERQKDAREDAKCFFLPRRRRSADGASLGCTTNFALDVYFALQFYYLKLLLAPLKVLKFWAFKLTKLLQNFLCFLCILH